MKSEQSEELLEAMREEMSSLGKNETQELVFKPKINQLFILNGFLRVRRILVHLNPYILKLD